VESVLREAEVSSTATRVPVRTAITFDPTAASPLISQEFPYVVFLRVDVESLHGDAEVSSTATTVPVRKGHNF